MADKRVVFYDPHKDGEGCSEPKPFALTAVLTNLDGLHCPLSEAIEDIQAACPDATVQDNGDYLHVGIGRHIQVGHIETREFNYRAIRYMEATNQ